jgi:hypothetical protein
MAASRCPSFATADARSRPPWPPSPPRLAACGATNTDSVTGGAGRSKGDAPAQAAAARAEAAVLLDGGPAAFRARLEALRGTPIVVNRAAVRAALGT